VIEDEGLLVTPGLVDLHVHVWWGVAHLAIEADPACVYRGVTTTIYAGSSGSNTIGGFHRYVIDQAHRHQLQRAHMRIENHCKLITPILAIHDSQIFFILDTNTIVIEVSLIKRRVLNG